MERFVSNPLALPPLADGYAWSDAQLIVYGVDHSGASHEVRVFLDAPNADATTPLRREEGYAGCFTVFGHGGCYGDDDHCDPNARFTDEYDLRLPHQSRPQTKVVRVTEALRAVEGNAVIVTLVAVEPGDAGWSKVSDAFRADELRLVTYAGAADTNPPAASREVGP